MTLFPRRSGWMVRLAVLLVLLLRTGLASAEPPGERPFRLFVDLAPSPGAPPVLDPQKLRADLAREIGRAVVFDLPAGTLADAGVVTITYRGNGEPLTVAFAPPDGEALTRTVLPPPGEDVAAMAVLLAGNLMRDQAAELLGPPPGPVVAVAPVPATAPPPDAELQARATENDADSSERVAGLRVEGDVWTGTLSLLNVGLRLSGETAYLLLSASGHQEKGRRMAGGGLTIGGHLPLFGPHACEIDLGATYIRGLDSLFPPPMQDPSEPNVNYTNSRLITRVRASLVFRVHPLVAVFAGSALAMTTHFYGVIDNEYGPELFAGVRL